MAAARVPLPIRAILAASRGAAALYRLFEALRDEVLLAFVAPEQRDAVTEAIYSHASGYLPGGLIFEQGLFLWEKALLARPEVPRRGRVLLAGAGGGRELKAFAERGYEVFAFEPSEELCVGCRAVSGIRGDAQVARGGYADLVRLARDGNGRLAGFRGPFDVVWMGWGSFTHVTVAEDHAAILESIRSLAPAAPVILSFYLHSAAPQRQGKIQRLRQAMRRILQYFGGKNVSWSVEYWTGVGFTYTFAEVELRSLFHAGGYSTVILEADPYPHALLIPLQVLDHRQK